MYLLIIRTISQFIIGLLSHKKEGKQTAYVYASTSNSEESKSFPANNMAALVRLVSENTLPNQWQYLDVSGGVVENRAEASCAKI